MTLLRQLGQQRHCRIGTRIIRCHKYVVQNQRHMPLSFRAHLNQRQSQSEADLITRTATQLEQRQVFAGMNVLD